MRPPSLAVVTIAMIATCSQVVSARSTIQDVRVLPTCAINPNDRVMLEVFVYSSSHPTYLFEPSQVTVLGSEILIDFFPTSGSLDMLSYRMFSVDLGSFPPGIYSFTIRVHNYREPYTQDYVGQFQVSREHRGSLRHLYWGDYRGMIKRCSIDGSKIEGVAADVTPLTFTIDADHRQIYWASIDMPIDLESKTSLERANLNGSERRTLVTLDWHTWPQYLTVTNGSLFWIGSSDWYSPFAIWRSNLDGTNAHTILNGLSSAGGLFASEREGKLFWSENYQIRRANFDGSGVETVQENSLLLALDPRHSRLFFSAWGEKPGLYGSNLDGTETAPIIVNDWISPLSLLLDCLPGKIYWLNQNPPAGIYRANTDGSDVEQILVDFASKDLEEFSCDRRTGKLYWTYGSDAINRTAGILMSANADGTDVRPIAEGVGWAFGLTVDRVVGNLLRRMESRPQEPRPKAKH